MILVPNRDFAEIPMGSRNLSPDPFQGAMERGAESGSLFDHSKIFLVQGI